jgi:hypothetical protein
VEKVKGPEYYPNALYITFLLRKLGGQRKTTMGRQLGNPAVCSFTMQENQHLTMIQGFLYTIYEIIKLIYEGINNEKNTYKPC